MVYFVVYTKDMTGISIYFLSEDKICFFKLKYAAQNLKSRGEERRLEVHWSKIRLESTVYS